MDALDNLYDIAMEAIAQRRDAEEDKVQKIVLPRLALQVTILILELVMEITSNSNQKIVNSL